MVAAAVSYPVEAASTDRRGAPCVDVSFSPQVEKDGIGFCAGVAVTGPGEVSFGIYRTRDGGESWSRVPAVGLTTTPGDSLGKVVVSPNFDTDNAVFVQAGTGLFRSTDEGATFELVDRLAGSSGRGENLFEYSETPLVGDTRTVFAKTWSAPAKVDPPRHTPVPASPYDDASFLFPADFAAERGGFVIAAETDSSDPQDPRARARFFACDATLTCAQPLFAFPWGTYPETALLAPDFETSGRILALLRTQPPSRTNPYQVWVSDDAGATFAPWRPVDRLLNRIEQGANPRIGFGVNPALPNRMYIRLHYARVNVPPSAPPADQVFRSNDGGDTWKRLASSDKGIPWLFPHPHEQPWRMLTLTADGRLVTPAVGYDYSGLYCSVDGGRTWHTTCRPR